MTPASLTFRVVRRNDGGIQNICASARFGRRPRPQIALLVVRTAVWPLLAHDSAGAGGGGSPWLPACLPACLGPGAGGGRVRRVLDSPRSAAIPKFSRDPMRPVFLLLLLLRPLQS